MTAVVGGEGIADYRFVEHIGEGSHGTLWQARPPARLGVDGAELVAVKVLAGRAGDRDFARMSDELRAYDAIDSPYLVPVFDAGYQDGRLYYTRAYFALGSLESPSRPLRWSEVIGVVARAALGAHALHEAGVAHRAIKPSNVLLDRVRPERPQPAGAGEGPDGPSELQGRLGDLDLAQVIRPGQTVTGVGPVEPIEYLAPEQVHGHRASRASDIWSLGVTLHRALTGRGVYPSFPTGSLLGALRHVTSSRPTIAPELDTMVAEVIGRCLDENPGGRYATAGELAEALRGVAGR